MNIVGNRDRAMTVKEWDPVLRPSGKSGEAAYPLVVQSWINCVNQPTGSRSLTVTALSDGDARIIPSLFKSRFGCFFERGTCRECDG